MAALFSSICEPHVVAHLHPFLIHFCSVLTAVFLTSIHFPSHFHPFPLIRFFLFLCLSLSMPSSTQLNFKAFFNFVLLKISPFVSGEITKLVGFRQEKTHFSKNLPNFLVELTTKFVPKINITSPNFFSFRVNPPHPYPLSNASSTFSFSVIHVCCIPLAA